MTDTSRSLSEQRTELERMREIDRLTKGGRAVLASECRLALVSNLAEEDLQPTPANFAVPELKIARPSGLDKLVYIELGNLAAVATLISPLVVYG